MTLSLGYDISPCDENQRRNISLHVLILLVAFIAPHAFSAVQTQYRFEHTVTDEGVNVGATNAIFQDSHGFMWFGGDNGAARFNGHSYTLFLPDTNDSNSIAHNYIWDITEDASGNIWFGTSKGLSRYNPVNKQFKTFIHSDAVNSLAQNIVRRVYFDSHQNLWVATKKGLDLYDPSTEGFTHHVHDDANPRSISDNFILSMFEDSQGSLWVGTKSGGINLYDYASRTFKHLEQYSTEDAYIAKAAVNDITEDANGNIWVATDKGLYRLHIENNRLVRYRSNGNKSKNEGADTSLSSDRVDRVLVDKNNQLWVMTNNAGLNIYDRKDDKFIQYRHDPYNNESIKSNQLKSMHQDKAGDFWFGLFPVGVDYINSSSSKFTVYRNKPNDTSSLSNNSINMIYPAMKGKIWIGSEGGVDLFDPSNNTFEHFVHDPNDEQSLAANAVLSITQDSVGDYWFGTWSGGLHRFNAENKTFERFLPKFKGQESNAKHGEDALSTIYVWSLLGDSQGNIWIGSQAESLDRYNLKSKKLTHFTPNIDDPKALSGIYIRQITEDAQGTIWIASLQGLNRFNADDETFTRFEHSDGDATSIADNAVATIFEDSHGTLWVGTDAGLSRMDRGSGTFKNYYKGNGLESDAISGISEDSRGDLWLNTKKGLTRFNIKDESFQTYTKFHGLAGHVSSRPATHSSRQGALYVGSTEGITHFRPANITDNPYIPPVFITQFSVFNDAIVAGQDNGLLTQDIRWTDTIVLDYEQSMISFDFAGLNFRNPEKNQYHYKMRGFDKKWINAGNKHSATYTNLNPGTYTFAVKAANNDGIWNLQPRTITIVQLPPPWLTWWAYTIYGLILCLLIFSFVRSQQRKVRDAMEKMEMEREVVKQMEKLDKLKDDFLANTSHELRTPLNGIIGLSDSILHGAAGEISEQLRSHLGMIAMSGKRLAHLVNDILDFSKLKSRDIHLHLAPIDISQTVGIVLAMNEPSTISKNLRLINSIDDTLPAVIADENRLQQILYNFIGNAIKFTDKGSITLSASREGESIWVHIKDTGIGIPSDKIDKIFDSFEQIEEHESRNHSGTGLGLSVTKKLVELHQGEIRVDSTQGQGSTFSFSLPISTETQQVGAGVTSADVLTKRYLDMDAKASEQKAASTHQTSNDVSSELEKESNARFKILIVDDDAVNRAVLLAQLKGQNYALITASSGAQALENFESDGPFDLILLDVMMPVMSGYEVCTTLRKRYSLQELPIIFLTAKNLISDLADAFELGANDFLTKPISIGELISRVRTHLQLLDMNRNLEVKVVQRTKEVTRANIELKTLDNIVATIHQELRFDRLLEVILREATTLFPNTHIAAYWKYDGDQQQFELLSLNDIDAEKHKNLNPADVDQETTPHKTMPQEKFEAYYLDQEGKQSDIIHTLDAEDIQTLAPICEDIDSAHSALLMPLILDKELLAILVLSSKKDHAFSQSNDATLDRFRSHVLSALNKTKLLDLLESQCHDLESMSVTDTLTGLHNRRFLHKYIPTDINKILLEHSIRLSGKTSGNAQPAKPQDYIFFMLDIDHFKPVNDTYGHTAGDKVISDIANIISGLFRESDYCIRWGGEEFLVVAKYSFRNKAPVMAEKIRLAIEQHTFILDDGTHLQKTCSIGYACYPFFLNQPESVSWQQVLDIADTCLYAAKKSQRNAWVGLYAGPDENCEQWDAEMLNAIEDKVDAGSWSVKTSIGSDKPLTW
ncbi:MAG: hypothetical protein COA42_18130 [Alteromonadaceae bacterium]|nr:MAG: hypothetical protein COA42_18130 [Alteromonadaceae bacterium]